MSEDNTPLQCMMGSMWNPRRWWPLLLGCALGLGIGWVDTRPTWDDTGITVVAVLGASGLIGWLAPGRPWLAALAVGAGVPALNIAISGNSESLVALVPAFLGAYAGNFGRRALLRPEAEFR